MLVCGQEPAGDPERCVTTLSHGDIIPSGIIGRRERTKEGEKEIKDEEKGRGKRWEGKEKGRGKRKKRGRQK